MGEPLLQLFATVAVLHTQLARLACERRIRFQGNLASPLLVPTEPRCLDTNQGIVVSERQTVYSSALAQDQEPFHLDRPMEPSAFASVQGDSDELISTEA